MALWEGLGGMRNDEILTLADGVAKDREGFDRTPGHRDRMAPGPPGLPGDRGRAPAGLRGGIDRIRSESAGRFSLPRVLQDMDLFILSRDLLEHRVSAQLVAENLFLKLGRA